MRMIRDFVEVEDQMSLDALIERLGTLRAELPVGSEGVEVRTSGCDIFGRKLSISFMRPQTADEVARDARYAAAPERIAA